MTAMARLLLVACLIIGLTLSVQAGCPPGMSLARCKHNSGTFKKGLIQELLERKNLKFDELDDKTLQRALDLLLEDEKKDFGGQQDFTLEEEERGPPRRELEGEDAERARSDEHLRQLLLKVLREE
ncbi:uncharacterized protein LOC119726197 [Patiria miniata]|uniref:Uncharacterized protein n=1 Tax=Patiria miniata TaxID=46514 RepID=A0A913ZPT2_PATMI|nr:uncharacterized protein LOC119726197 [Patiria miniata]